MTHNQGTVVIAYIIALFIQNGMIISMLREIRDILRNLKKENE